MSTEPAHAPASSHGAGPHDDHHEAFDPEPVQELAADETPSPGWLPVVGGVLLLVGVGWVFYPGAGAPLPGAAAPAVSAAPAPTLAAPAKSWRPVGSAVPKRPELPAGKKPGVGLKPMPKAATPRGPTRTPPAPPGGP
jgi:hypothetical protein